MRNLNDAEVTINSEEITPGESLKIEHTLYYDSKNGTLSPYLGLPLEELEQSREQSIERERELLEAVKETAQKWDEQAANTLRLEKAIEYRKIPAVEHSSNTWVKGPYGNLEISNMVYRMYYKILEETKYNTERKQTECVGWSLSWNVMFNTCRRNSGNTSIDGQSRKFFNDKERLDKYVQGRFKAYSHLFQEISPPIPPEYAGHFKINGCLLPGYTIGQPNPQKQAPTRRKESHGSR